MTKPPNGGLKWGVSVWFVLWVILKNAKIRPK